MNNKIKKDKDCFIKKFDSYKRQINIKLLISTKHQITKKSFKKIDKIENSNKLKIIKNLVSILKKKIEIKF